MPKLRVLIVDDSVVIRRIVTDIISGDSDLEVAGVAANGRVALDKVAQVNPDIITLDIEMPEMDGLQALKELRKRHPRLPVIMFSTLTERGATATIDALSLGASDYVTKPANIGRIGEGMIRVRDDLIPKIKALCGRPTAVIAKSTAQQRLRSVAAKSLLRTDATRLEILAIGASTGGPNALADLLPRLPPDFPIPVVIVQHMPPIFTKLLADRLSAKSSLHVVEAIAGDELSSGRVWIAPGNYHMAVQKAGNASRIHLNQEAPENSCRPSVDALFRSVADLYGAATLGVVLTGMGQDGLRGCEYIKEAGGQVLVQDEASSVVWGMPGFVAKAGLADRELPLGQIADEIVRRVAEGRTKPLGLQREANDGVYFRH